MLPERSPPHGPWYAYGGPIDGEAAAVADPHDGDEHVVRTEYQRHHYEFRDCTRGRPSIWTYGAKPLD